MHLRWSIKKQTKQKRAKKDGDGLSKCLFFIALLGNKRKKVIKSALSVSFVVFPFYFSSRTCMLFFMALTRRQPLECFHMYFIGILPTSFSTILLYVSHSLCFLEKYTLLFIWNDSFGILQSVRFYFIVETGDNDDVLKQKNSFLFYF